MGSAPTTGASCRALHWSANLSSQPTQLTVKGTKFECTEECQDAFTRLKEALCSAPVLAYPDTGVAMLLDTDASNVGVGALLSQPGRRGRSGLLGTLALNRAEKTTV